MISLILLKLFTFSRVPKLSHATVWVLSGFVHRFIMCENACCESVTINKCLREKLSFCVLQIESKPCRFEIT